MMIAKFRNKLVSFYIALLVVLIIVSPVAQQEVEH